MTGPVPRLLTLGASVSVNARSAEIVRRSGTDAHPILRLRGVDGRTAAEALRGMPLTVAATGAPQLGEQEWWAHELQDCEVFDGELLLGRVTQLIELPSCEAIEVDPTGGGNPLIVPLVRDAIRQVDAPGRRIDVDGEFLGLPSPAVASQDPAARDAPKDTRAGEDPGTDAGAQAGGGRRDGD